LPLLPDKSGQQSSKK